MPKKTATHTITSMYKTYAKNTPEAIRVPYKLFVRIIDTFGAKFYESILYGSNEVRLPNIGEFRVIKKKMCMALFDRRGCDNNNKVKIDWAATKKAGKRIFHLNEHRDGHSYQLKWRKRAVTGIYIYKFRAIRRRKRELASILQNRPEIDYFM